MARKSRRARKKMYATRPIPSTGKTQVPQPYPVIAKEPPRLEATAKKTVDFATEYRYVYTDLKRIAITAMAMLAILIILAFVIR